MTTTYIVGPSDTKEHEQWSAELGRLLESDLEDFPLRLPVSADEITARLQPVVEANVKLALVMALRRNHLDRATTLQFQLFLSLLGTSGILNYTYRVDLDPVVVRCVSCDGMLDASARRPQ